jgi:hypothetical protein
MQMDIDKLKKIAALAAEGVGGERDNAQRHIVRLLDAEGLTLDDLPGLLAEHEKTWYKFKYQTAFQRQLLCQVVATACRTRIIKNRDGSGKTRYFLLTASQYAEAESLYTGICKAWKKELNKFELAFIVKQRLCCDFDDGGSDDDTSTLTQEELEAIIGMASSITKINHRTQLAGGA